MIDRRTFLETLGILGVSLPFAACNNGKANPMQSIEGKVLIVGAGAAGLSAGYLLAQRGADFTIIEAGPQYGGRMKHHTGFTDFPIPLGAEWLHARHGELAKIVNDNAVAVETRTVGYRSSDPVALADNGTLRTSRLGAESDRKFVGTTWFGFFENYIAPAVEARIQYDTQITEIDYTGDEVRLQDASGQIHLADKVIVTAPLKILQAGDIRFAPPLPRRKTDALAAATVWDGFKAFFEFSEKFYPTYLAFPDSSTDEGQRLYYDAAYGQDTQSHILGLFSVGKQARAYQAFEGDALRDHVLGELDPLYDGKASATYVKHIAQDWNQEPFIGGAYLEDDAPSYISRVLAEALEGKVFFAGDAYTREDDWSAVHNAARAARDAVAEIAATLS